MAAIAYLCSDLLFTSKIRETARTLGHEALLARDAASLAQIACGAQLVILDLRRPDAVAALAALAADPTTRAIDTVGFINHEQTERMAEARGAGCTHVLAKGKFSSDLHRLMAHLGAHPAPAGGEAPVPRE